MRRLHRAERGPELDRGKPNDPFDDAQSGEEHFNAAFVRGSEPLPLSEPFRFLTANTSRLGLGGTLMPARVDASGTVLGFHQFPYK